MDAIGEQWLIPDLAVGPLPQHPPHPQHPRRVFRCDLLCPALQAQVVAGVHRSWFRCRQGLGGVRLCKSCEVFGENATHISDSIRGYGVQGCFLRLPALWCCHFSTKPLSSSLLNNTNSPCTELQARICYLPRRSSHFPRSLFLRLNDPHTRTMRSEQSRELGI